MAEHVPVTKKPIIIVVVEGGVVQGVLCTQDARVKVVNCDNAKTVKSPSPGKLDQQLKQLGLTSFIKRLRMLKVW